MGKLLKLRRLNDTDFAAYTPEDGEMVFQSSNLHLKAKVGSNITELDLITLQTHCVIGLICANSISKSYVDCSICSAMQGTIYNSLNLNGQPGYYYINYINQEVNKFKNGLYQTYCSQYAQDSETLTGVTYSEILTDIDQCTLCSYNKIKTYTDLCASILNSSISTLDAKLNTCINTVQVNLNTIKTNFENGSDKVYCSTYATEANNLTGYTYDNIITTIDDKVDQCRQRVTTYVDACVNKLMMGTERVYCSTYSENAITLSGYTYDNIISTIDDKVDQCRERVTTYIDGCMNILMTGSEKVYCASYAIEAKTLNGYDQTCFSLTCHNHPQYMTVENFIQGSNIFLVVEGCNLIISSTGTAGCGSGITIEYVDSCVSSVINYVNGCTNEQKIYTDICSSDVVSYVNICINEQKTYTDICSSNVVSYVNVCINSQKIYTDTCSSNVVSYVNICINEQKIYTDLCVSTLKNYSNVCINEQKTYTDLCVSTLHSYVNVCINDQKAYTDSCNANLRTYVETCSNCAMTFGQLCVNTLRTYVDLCSSILRAFVGAEDCKFMTGEYTVACAVNAWNACKLEGHFASCQAVANTIVLRNRSGQIEGTLLGTATNALDSATVGGYTPSASATPNAVAVRNASGVLVGNITGNSATATTLATGRVINLCGSVNGCAVFNGGSNIGINVALNCTGVVSGNYTQVQVNEFGQVVAGLCQLFGVTCWNDITYKPTTIEGAGILNGMTVNCRETVTSKKTFAVAPEISVANGVAPLIVTSETLVVNLNVDEVDGYHATTGNVPSTIVVRDANNDICGNLNGNSQTTNKIKTSRKIELIGRATGWCMFDGSTDIFITAGVSPSSNALYATCSDILDGYHACANITANTIPVRDAFGRIAGNITGKSPVATILETCRLVCMYGMVNGCAWFDGSQNVIIEMCFTQKAYDYIEKCTSNVTDYFLACVNKQRNYTDVCSNNAFTNSKSYTDDCVNRINTYFLSCVNASKNYTEVCSSCQNLYSKAYTDNCAGVQKTYIDTCSYNQFLLAKTYTDMCAGIQKTYIDTCAYNQLVLAKTYTDMCAGVQKTYIDVCTNNALTNAKAYTDTCAGVQKTYIDVCTNNSLTNAKAYTDMCTGIQRTYINDCAGVQKTYIDACAYNQFVLAKTYTDMCVSVQKTYIDVCVNNTLTNAKVYTDVCVNKARTDLITYTDVCSNFRVNISKIFIDDCSMYQKNLMKIYVDDCSAKARIYVETCANRSIVLSNVYTDTCASKSRLYDEACAYRSIVLSNVYTDLCVSKNLGGGGSGSTINSTAVISNWCIIPSNICTLYVCSGNGYFIDTTYFTVCVNLPKTPIKNEKIAIKKINQYGYNVIVCGNTNIVESNGAPYYISTQISHAEFVYKDATNGWVNTENSTYLLNQPLPDFYHRTYLNYDVVGVVMTSNPTSYVYIDENLNSVTPPNTAWFNGHPTYCNIKEILINGNCMISIPAFYIKTQSITSGAYSGNDAIFISPVPKTGFVIHPAFIYGTNGVVSNIYIGKFQGGTDGSKMVSWSGVQPQKVTYNQAVSNASGNNGTSTDWHLWNIHELSAIKWLMLIEAGTGDLVSAYGQAAATQTVSLTNTDIIGSGNWRGFIGLWGNANQWVDGLYLPSTCSYVNVRSPDNTSWISTNIQQLRIIAYNSTGQYTQFADQGTISTQTCALPSYYKLNNTTCNIMMECANNSFTPANQSKYINSYTSAKSYVTGYELRYCIGYGSTYYEHYDIFTGHFVYVWGASNISSDYQMYNSYASVVGRLAKYQI